MDRKLIIEGNAVYEIDEKCMLKKHLEDEREKEQEEAAERKDRMEG